MEGQLSTVCTDVENLKCTRPQEQWAQLPGEQQVPGMAQSATNSPVTGVDDNVVTRLSWEDQMELEDEQDANSSDTKADHPKGEKLCLTEVEKETRDFLREVFNTLDNEDCKDIRRKFIVPDTSFTTPPRLDKVMAAECSKSTKSTDHTLSRIQVLFLDAVGPLTGLIDEINKGNEISIEDVEAAVKAALTLMGNASSHCNAERRTLVLEEYNKDLVSFGQDSELYSSAATTLFGPSFPEKAVEHLKQLHTLRQARGTPKTTQGFNKPLQRYSSSQRGGRTGALQRRHMTQPYSRGSNSSRGRGKHYQVIRPSLTNSSAND